MKEKEYGYIKLYRSLNNNEVLANDNNAFVVFVRLLTLVNRHSGTYTTGRKKLAVYMNMNDRTLYGVLKRLERATMLQLTSNKYATTIHICKWHDWQQDDNRSSTEPQTVRNTKQEREREEELDTKVSKSLVKKSSDVEEVFELWKQTTGRGVIATKRSQYSKIVRALIDNYGIEAVKQVIVASYFYRDKEYRPKVFNFVDMNKKWDALVGWVEKDLKAKNSKMEDLDI